MKTQDKAQLSKILQDHLDYADHKLAKAVSKNNREHMIQYLQEVYLLKEGIKWLGIRRNRKTSKQKKD